MVFRHRIFVALFCALALLVAQQGAFAHALTHLGPAGADLVAEAGGTDADGDGKAASAAHACVSCLAFGVGAAPPMAAVLPGVPVLAAAAPVFAPLVAGVAGRTVVPYTSRAPPAFL